MNNLHETTLLKFKDYNSQEDEYFENTVHNNGDYILDQFYNGNWDDGVKNMLEIYATPNDIADYMDELSEDGLIDESFFDRASVATVASIYYELRKES